jgi:cyanophycin synthetase
MNLSLSDSRRLTGANLFWERPGAIVDVEIEGSADELIKLWAQTANKLLDAVDHTGERLCHRLYDGGASLLISAPIDALYSMCELNELAFHHACMVIKGGADKDLQAEIEQLLRLFAEESRPGLLALQKSCVEHAVPFLWDDDEVSVGYGKRSQVWAYDQLPDPEHVAWNNLGSVPVALVTGTNGKSTTVRMTAAIIKAAGLSAGLTSTDFIRVGEQIIENGDYSGTGGARQLLRHGEVDMAVLEVARGGLLRRGLGVDSADVALVNNVAADHLGEYGINTVPELIEAKFIVARALGEHAPLVLNADDEGVVNYASQLSNRIWWFGLDEKNLKAVMSEGDQACWIADGFIVSNAGSGISPSETRSLIAIRDISSTRGGLIRHNIQNAMAATLISLALGLPDQAIGDGLVSFRGDEADNPGRGNWFEARGVQIVVDFAHNEHGLQSLANSILAMQATRVELTLGQAGDRSDELIRSLARVGCSMSPDRLLVCELPGYERGRDPGAAAALIREEAVVAGMQPASIEMFDSPVEAVRDALSRASSGDVLVFLALMQRTEILQLVHDFINGTS